MGQIIVVDFEAKRVIARTHYFDAAKRLDAEAGRQPQQTARTLRKLAAAYRQRSYEQDRAAEGAGV